MRRTGEHTMRSGLPLCQALALRLCGTGCGVDTVPSTGQTKQLQSCRLVSKGLALTCRNVVRNFGMDRLSRGEPEGFAVGVSRG